MKSRSPAQQAFLHASKPKFGMATLKPGKGLSIKPPAMPRLTEAHKLRGQKTFRVK